MKKKISWKRNSGDNEETYDTYLWVDGKPTTSLASPVSGMYFIYVNDVEIGMADTLKEAKTMILEELGL